MISKGSAYIGTCAGAMFGGTSQTWRDTTYTQVHGQLGIFEGNSNGPILELFDYPAIGMCMINLTEYKNQSDICLRPACNALPAPVPAC